MVLLFFSFGIYICWSPGRGGCRWYSSKFPTLCSASQSSWNLLQGFELGSAGPRPKPALEYLLSKHLKCGQNLDNNQQRVITLLISLITIPAPPAPGDIGEPEEGRGPRGWQPSWHLVNSLKIFALVLRPKGVRALAVGELSEKKCFVFEAFGIWWTLRKIQKLSIERVFVCLARPCFQCQL